MDRGLSALHFMKYLVLNNVLLYRNMNDRKEREGVQRQKKLHDEQEWHLKGSERHGYGKYVRSKCRRNIFNNLEKHEEVRRKWRTD